MDDDKWNSKVKDQFISSVSTYWDESYITETFAEQNPEAFA